MCYAAQKTLLFWVRQAATRLRRMLRYALPGISPNYVRQRNSAITDLVRKTYTYTWLCDGTWYEHTVNECGVSTES